MPPESPDIPANMLDAIRAYLRESGVSYREVHHGETRTSEESARARGEDLRIRGKALLIKADDEYRLFVLPADCRLDSSAVRRELGLKRTRFASPEELFERTGLVPGSVPPFGHPLLPFDLYVDSGISGNDRIAFNAGSLTDSVIMSTDDYFRLANPSQVFSFSRRDSG